MSDNDDREGMFEDVWVPLVAEEVELPSGPVHVVKVGINPGQVQDHFDKLIELMSADPQWHAMPDRAQALILYMSGFRAALEAANPHDDVDITQTMALLFAAVSLLDIQQEMHDEPRPDRPGGYL